MFKTVSMMALVASVALSATAARAQDPLPGAEYLGTITIFNQNDPQPEVPALTGPGTIASGGAQLTFGAAPTPFISSASTLNGANAYTINGEVKYYFRVDGPASDDPIMLTAHLVLHADQTTALSSVIVLVNAFQSAVMSLGSAPGFTYDQTYDQTVGFEAMAGALNYVDLKIGTQGGVTDTYADPYIAIDPQFAAAHPGYSVSFSPGIGNARPGGVPEPAAWALMVVGLGGAGSLLRRRRRSDPVASL